MITQVFIDNFRSLRGFSLGLGDYRFVLMGGESGSGKSSFCGAIMLLRDAAVGAGSVNQLVRGCPTSLPINGARTTFTIDFTQFGNSYRYSLEFLYDRIRGEFVAEKEYIICNGVLRCNREGNVATAWSGTAQPITYAIDVRSFLLSNASGANPQDPLFIVKRYLSSILIALPSPQLMQGDFVNPPTWMLNPGGANLPNWFAWQLQTDQGVQDCADGFLRRYIPGAIGLSVVNSMQGLPMLVLRRKGIGGSSYDVAFSALSSSERLRVYFSVLAAFVRSHPESTVIMDDVLRILDAQSRMAIAEDLHDMLAQSGQLLMVSGCEDVNRAFWNEAKVRFVPGGAPEVLR